jgi:hypothetical protein
MLKKEDDLKKHEELEARLTRELPKKEEAVEHALRAREAADDRIQQTQYQLQDLDEKIGYDANTLRNLESRRTNELAAFGHGIENVLKDIDRARWAGAKPVGPLGRYVKLNDFAYKGLMEANLGSILCSFAVQDSRDRGQLQGILQNALRYVNFETSADCRNGYKPGFLGQGQRSMVPAIYVSSNDIFDYSSGDNSTYGETLLSKLTVSVPGIRSLTGQFSDEYVKRVLINQAQIEKNFVAPTQEAASAMITRMTQSGIPRVVVFSAQPMVRQEGDGR